MGKIDYKKLEKEYMTTNTSLGKICEKHKVSRSAVYKYAAEHNWQKRRTEKQEIRTEKDIERTFEEQADAWSRIQKLMLASLASDWEQYYHNTGAYKLQELTKATKDARDMGLFGPTTSEQKTLVEIEALKKELNATDADKTIIVHIEGNEDFSK